MSAWCPSPPPLLLYLVTEIDDMPMGLRRLEHSLTPVLITLTVCVDPREIFVRTLAPSIILAPCSEAMSFTLQSPTVTIVIVSINAKTHGAHYVCCGKQPFATTFDLGPNCAPTHSRNHCCPVDHIWRLHLKHTRRLAPRPPSFSTFSTWELASMQGTSLHADIAMPEGEENSVPQVTFASLNPTTLPSATISRVLSYRYSDTASSSIQATLYTKDRKDRIRLSSGACSESNRRE